MRDVEIRGHGTPGLAEAAHRGAERRRSNSRERLFCRTRMQLLDLPTHAVTEAHRDAFRAAYIEWQDGQDLNVLLCSLDEKQIAMLTGILTARIGRKDGA